METNKSIEQVLEMTDSTIVYKQKTSPVKAILFLVLGIAFFVINSLIEWDKNSFIHPMLFLVAPICSIVGVFAFFFRKNHFVSAENHQELIKYELYFDSSQREKLVRLLENNNFSELQNLKPSINQGLKLRILATKDVGLCFAQVVAFASPGYYNVNQVKQYTPDEAKLLLGALQLLK